MLVFNCGVDSVGGMGSVNGGDDAFIRLDVLLFF